jgi:hypothetical protein
MARRKRRNLVKVIVGAEPRVVAPVSPDIKIIAPSLAEIDREWGRLLLETG